MGAVTVHPQDVLKDQFNYFHNRSFNPKPLISSPPPNSPKMKSGSDFAPKSNRNRNPNPRATRQKQSSTNWKNITASNTGGRRYMSKLPPQKSKNTQLVMEKVKILKRGEALTDNTAPLQKVNLVKKTDENQKIDNGGESSDLLVAKQIYAGSAFITSPSPSSVPMPGFFRKSSGALTEINNDNDDDSTSGLLKLLKLSL